MYSSASKADFNNLLKVAFWNVCLYAMETETAEPSGLKPGRYLELEASENDENQNIVLENSDNLRLMSCPCSECFVYKVCPAEAS